VRDASRAFSARLIGKDAIPVGSSPGITSDDFAASLVPIVAVFRDVAPRFPVC
jgi:hypothetical protein